jgi:hypothetical protein
VLAPRAEAVRERVVLDTGAQQQLVGVLGKLHRVRTMPATGDQDVRGRPVTLAATLARRAREEAF